MCPSEFLRVLVLYTANIHKYIMVMVDQTTLLDDLIKLREKLLKDLEELDSIIETLEIMSDEELMKSIERAKKQQPKRDFEDFLAEIGIDLSSVSD